MGGVIAAGASSFRRRRVGHVRDTVVEMTTVTGDGRTITSGARTVKNVSGFDVHRLMTGSLGTLGRHRPGRAEDPAAPPRPSGAPGVGRRRDGARRPARYGGAASGRRGGVAGRVTVHLEGWPDEVSELETMAGAIASLEAVDDPDGPLAPRGDDRGRGGGRHRRACRRCWSRHDRWQALAGVGIAWVGVDGPEELATLRATVAEAGGIAPAIRGPGGLGTSAVPAPEVHRRLKAAFDPHGVLAPGRFWDGG